MGAVIPGDSPPGNIEVTLDEMSGNGHGQAYYDVSHHLNANALAGSSPASTREDKPAPHGDSETLVTDVFAPPVIYDRMVAAGVKKSHHRWPNQVLLGIMAGLYIGLGSMLALTVGADADGLKEDNPGLQK